MNRHDKMLSNGDSFKLEDIIRCFRDDATLPVVVNGRRGTSCEIATREWIRSYCLVASSRMNETVPRIIHRNGRKTVGRMELRDKMGLE